MAESLFIGDVYTVDAVKFDPSAAPDAVVHRVYTRDEEVGGKTLAEYFDPTWAAAWWHTMLYSGAQPFGAPTRGDPFGGPPKTMEQAKFRVRLMFTTCKIMGTSRYCFHDLDVIPAPKDAKEYVQFMTEISDYMLELQNSAEFEGIKLLWGTACLFAPPCYMDGASTSPETQTFDFACLQVRTMIDVTIKLGGVGYVFWGGRDGYDFLWDVRLRQQRQQYIALLKMASDYRDQKAPGLIIMIEPKAKEPRYVQADTTVAVVLGLLAEAGLIGKVQINFEKNHAVLGLVDPFGEIILASEYGMLAGIDVNKEAPGVLWDEDQFGTLDPVFMAQMMWVARRQGWMKVGFNNDARIRRQAIYNDAVLIAHAGALDAATWGLRTAVLLERDGYLADIVEARVASWKEAHGQDILAGKTTLVACADRALAQNSWPVMPPGKQEKLESYIQSVLMRAAAQGSAV